MNVHDQALSQLESQVSFWLAEKKEPPAAAALVLMLGGYALVRNGTGISSVNTEEARALHLLRNSPKCRIAEIAHRLPICLKRFLSATRSL